MPASRSVMSALVRELGDLLYSLKAGPAGGLGTVQRAFLTESSFVALEGILLGTALGMVTTYLLFQNDPSVDHAGRGFPSPG